MPTLIFLNNESCELLVHTFVVGFDFVFREVDYRYHTCADVRADYRTYVYDFCTF